MSCPSCQVGGRRLPSLPLGYIPKTKKDLHYKSLRTLGILNGDYNIQHVGSARVNRRQKRLVSLEGIFISY